MSEFKIDSELKEEFLDSLKKSTRKIYSHVLKKADAYEDEIGKSIYDFNFEDRDELLLVKFKNTTIGAFRSNLSPLKRYVYFCIAKNAVKHNDNRFAMIHPSDYINYVSVQAQENTYISKTEVRELQKELVNAQDKLILELLTWGIRGRTEKGNTQEELINLKVSDVDFDNNILKVINNDGDDRDVYVDDYTINLIKEIIEEDIYICKNGKKPRNKEPRKLPIAKTDYVFRIAGRDKSEKVDSQYFIRKVQLMKRYLKEPYLSISNLYFSAIIDYAKKRKNEKGELTRKDYIEINEMFRYGNTKERQEAYVNKTSELVKPYI